MAVAVTRLLSTTVTSTGQPIVMPRNDVELVVSIYEVGRHGALPEHQHPYPRFGYVLKGRLRVTDITDSATHQTKDYKPGDFIVESVGQWHLGTNIGQGPIKLVVIDIVEKGHTNTVLQR
jgi:quercetin dioxygenase-like cupin family protein